MYVTKYDDMEQFERLLRSYLHRLAVMVSAGDRPIKYCELFSGYILTQGMTQDSDLN